MALISKYENQTVFDVLLIHSGAISGLFDFLESNGLTELNIPEGQYITPEVLRKEVVEFLSAKNVPATVATSGGIAYGAPVIVRLNDNILGSYRVGDANNILLKDQDNNLIDPIEFSDTLIRVQLNNSCPPCVQLNQAAKLIQTGQSSNYGTSDDVTRGRLSDFFILPYVHEFGHQYRFCGLTGGYSDGIDYFSSTGTPTIKSEAFPDDIILDFSSRSESEILTYYIGDIYTTRSYIDAIELHYSSTIGGLNRWYLWNDFEMNNIRNVDAFYSLNHWIGYSPFEFGSGQRYLITSTRSDTTIVRTDLQSVGYAAPTTITNALYNVFTRYTLLSEIGL